MTLYQPGRIHRRDVLLGGVAVSGAWSSRCASTAADPGSSDLDGEIWISAAGVDDETFALAAATRQGHIIEIPSGVRGHEVVGHPRHPERVLLFARAPGTQIVEFDLKSRSVLRRVTCEDGRFLAGHACFSSSADVLFTIECDDRSGDGFVVVRDADDLRFLDEFSSHGIGPHQLVMMPDGRRLAVANGGLVTRGQQVLNIETMRSTLTFLDAASGSLDDEWTVREPKSSIRHLDVSAAGTLALAMQVQREGTGHNDVVPLTAIYKDGSGLEELTAPTELLAAMNDYVGSVKIGPETRTAAFSSPRGDLALFWNTDSGDLMGHHVLADVCGITVSQEKQAFVLSSSSGLLRAIDASTLEEITLPELSAPDVAWDNHMCTLVATP